MKSYTDNPATPTMLQALRELYAGHNLHRSDYPKTGVGKITKQRLAKFGLASFDAAKDWDGPMHITAKGVDVLQLLARCGE